MKLNQEQNSAASALSVVVVERNERDERNDEMTRRRNETKSLGHPLGALRMNLINLDNVDNFSISIIDNNSI